MVEIDNDKVEHSGSYFGRLLRAVKLFTYNWIIFMLILKAMDCVMLSFDTLCQCQICISGHLYVMCGFLFKTWFWSSHHQSVIIVDLWQFVM